MHTLHSVQPRPFAVDCPCSLSLADFEAFFAAYSTSAFLNSFHNFITAASCSLLHLLVSWLRFQQLTKVATELSTNWCFTSVNGEHSSDFASCHHRDDDTAVQLSLCWTGHLERSTRRARARQNNEGQNTKNKTAVNVAIHLLTCKNSLPIKLYKRRMYYVIYI